MRVASPLIVVLVGVGAFLLGRYSAQQPSATVELRDPWARPAPAPPELAGLRQPHSQAPAVAADQPPSKPADQPSSSVSDLEESREALPESSTRALEVALDSIDHLARTRFYEVLPLVAKVDLPKIDIRFVQAARKNAITPWNVDGWVLPYMWKTERTTWADFEPLIRSGMASGDDSQVSTFVILALYANPPPEPAWFEWALGRHRFPKEVVKRIQAHLELMRRDR